MVLEKKSFSHGGGGRADDDDSIVRKRFRPKLSNITGSLTWGIDSASDQIGVTRSVTYDIQ